MTAFEAAPLIKPPALPGVSDFSKALAWFEKLLWVSLPYDYLGASPQAVTRPFADVWTHPGRRFVAHVRPVTPAMAAGMTNHV